MLQTIFSASCLDSEDLALLSRVLEAVSRQNDTEIDRETQAAVLLQLFQAGVRDEEALIRAMARNEVAQSWRRPAHRIR